MQIDQEMECAYEDRSHSAEISRVTWIGMFVNIGLAIVKFTGGFLGGSQAVVADAVHSLSDMSTDIAILLGVRYWTKPADEAHPHGHRRIEALITLGIGILLAAVATGILWNAISTMHKGHDSTPGWIALAAAVASIISKEILYRWTLVVGQRIKSAPVIANAWHHRTDAFSSIPVVLAVIGAMIDPAWSFLDHVGAVVVSFFIYQAAYQIILPNFEKLIDRGAPEEELKKIKMITLETDGVLSVHKVRTRYVGASGLAVDLHIEVDPDLSVRRGHEISEDAKHRLLDQGPDIVDVVIHLEPFENDNSTN